MNNEDNRFKEFTELKEIISEIKEDIIIDRERILDSKDDDFGINFFPDIDYDFLRENASKIIPESFVYQYCLSNEEREFLDSIREVKEPTLTLKK